MIYYQFKGNIRELQEFLLDHVDWRFFRLIGSGSRWDENAFQGIILYDQNMQSIPLKRGNWILVDGDRFHRDLAYLNDSKED